MQFSDIVIDTSLVVHALTNDVTLGKVATEFLQSTLLKCNYFAPPLFSAEVESTLNLWRLSNRKSNGQLKLVRQTLMDLNIEIIHYPESHLIAREIADHLRLPRVYDATFAALAKIKQVDYYTADKTFYNVAHRKYPFVKLVA